MPLSSVLGAQSITKPGVCTSTTRPSSPFDGQVIYETDTNTLAVYDGAGWVSLNPVNRDRNLLINGAMQIDQRNVGSSYTMANATFGLDRWGGYSSSASKYGVQRLTTTPPSGFNYYQRVTSLAATADTSAAYYNIYQNVEGFNVSSLAWGTANAQSVSLSFWVRSSLTGTFGGTIRNGGTGGYYSYAFTYTISAANTWEKKTISIIGSTSGTWGSTNNIGLTIFFDIGCGSGETQAAGSWQNANKLGANGCVKLIGTNAATWDITGVQLEAGSVATPFEFEDYGTTLRKCQRYYEKSYAIETAPGTATTANIMLVMPGHGGASTAGAMDGYVFFKVTKRAGATVTIYDANGVASKCRRTAIGVANYDNQSTQDISVDSCGFYFRSPSGTSSNTMSAHFVASAEL